MPKSPAKTHGSNLPPQEMVEKTPANIAQLNFLSEFINPSERAQIDNNEKNA